MLNLKECKGYKAQGNPILQSTMPSHTCGYSLFINTIFVFFCCRKTREGSGHLCQSLRWEGFRFFCGPGRDQQEDLGPETDPVDSVDQTEGTATGDCLWWEKDSLTTTDMCLCSNGNVNSDLEGLCLQITLVSDDWTWPGVLREAAEMKANRKRSVEWNIYSSTDRYVVHRSDTCWALILELLYKVHF